jgi:predicted dehydrogenase/nucleoside-diphosphate-sugar epimerase
MVAQAEQIERPAARPAELGGPRPFRGEGKVRVALIGCGAATRELHLPVLSGHEGVEVAALVDRDLKRAGELAAAYRVPHVLDDAGKLDRSRADAVVVCTPPFLHAPGAIEMARKGFHVLVEKPMATRYEDAERMVEAAREAGVVLAVGVFRRLLPSTRSLRALLDSGWLGRPLSFDVEEGEVYAWPTATLGNMRRDLAGGGVLIDFGSHTFDRLLSWFPGPAEVIEYRENARGGIEADCVARLRLTAADGTRVEGRVELSRLRNLRNTFRVTCERGTLELPSNERYHVRIHPNAPDFRDAITGASREAEVRAGWAGEQETSWYEAFRVQLDDWVEAMRGNKPSALSAESVLPSFKLIADCYASPSPTPLVEPGVEETFDRKRQPLAPHVGNGKPRRALITGATGFIGGRVAEVLSLRDGWEVRALVHNPSRASRLARLPVEMVLGDLGTEADAARLTEGCDAVVHCAIGNEWGNRRHIFEVTVGGTGRLARAALKNKVGRFVNISTFAIHDLQQPGVISEDTAPNPPRGNDYAESKAEADRVVAQTAAEGLCAVTLRLPNVYGPFSTIFITRPIGHLAKGELVLVGPAERPSSTVHVDSVVEAICRGLEAPESAVHGKLYTISDGDDLNWRDFFGYFAKACGRELPVISAQEFAAKHQPKRGWLRWAMTPLRGVKEVATSPEMWGLAKRVLKTEPLYSSGRWVLGRVPGAEARVRRWLTGEGPVVYRRQPAGERVEPFFFELTQPAMSNERARKELGFAPPLSREQAMAVTLDWLRYARIVP